MTNKNEKYKKINNLKEELEVIKNIMHKHLHLKFVLTDVVSFQPLFEIVMKMLNVLQSLFGAPI